MSITACGIFGAAAVASVAVEAEVGATFVGASVDVAEAGELEVAVPLAEASVTVAVGSAFFRGFFSVAGVSVATVAVVSITFSASLKSPISSGVYAPQTTWGQIVRT